MAPARFVGAAIIAAIAGLIAITIYLVIERAVAEHLSPALCLQQLLQWDASNAYGAKAFDGGWPMALGGLAMDCVVALCWALVFTGLYVSFAAVRQNVAISGLVFGAIVMGVMIFGIVPLGHAVQLQRTPAHVVNVLVAHTIFFGLPVALAVQAVAV
jgi:hypothetical protein